MHELSIAAALVEQVGAVVTEHDAGRARRVAVRIGSLSGVDPEALRMAFPVAAEGTACGNAELEIEFVAASILCRACGAETAPDIPFAVCERCGSTDVDVRGGADLLLTRVEMD